MFEKPFICESCIPKEALDCLVKEDIFNSLTLDGIIDNAPSRKKLVASRGSEEDVNTSSDPYIKMRSFYIQNRRNNIFLDTEYKNMLIDQEEEEFEKLLY